jgi:prolyl 4-hydroxylase
MAVTNIVQDSAAASAQPLEESETKIDQQNVMAEHIRPPPPQELAQLQQALIQIISSTNAAALQRSPSLPQIAALSLLQQQITHNLIPNHLQAQSLAASLDGTPGNQPALIPPGLTAPTRSILCPVTVPMTVQDYPFMPPIYNGINMHYPGLRLLNANPPVYAVDNFLTTFECEFLVRAASDNFTPAPVVGKGAGEISPSRTSSTCYLAREDLPNYMRKVSLLTGKPIEHCELPQVGRYLSSQKYLQHFDAFDLSTVDGLRFASNGGQRVVTILVYLNDVARGGCTHFPCLNLSVQPRQGMAVVFFPASVDGFLDKAALHAALPAIDTKFVSQVWIRQSNYTGQASKRLPQILGVPVYTPPTSIDAMALRQGRH